LNYATRESQSSPKLFVGGLALLALGGWVGFTSVRAIYRQEVSKNWPRAPGVITHVEWRTGHFIPYTLLRYRYEVSGYRHEGETEDLPHYDYGQLNQMFKQRKAVSVCYSPEDPRVSVFDPGLSPHRAFMLLASLFCVWAGVVCVRIGA
jgi:hypothetical protein